VQNYLTEPVPKSIFVFGRQEFFRIVLVIMSLIDYSKYKAQETNFEFWMNS